MAEQTTKGKKAGGSKPASVKSTLAKIGVDESVVGVWQDQAKRALSQKVQTKVDEFDVEDAIETAKKFASMSSEKLKDAARANPKKFYSGLAAVLVGAGLLAAAARAPKPPRPSAKRRTPGPAGTEGSE